MMQQTHADMWRTAKIRQVAKSQIMLDEDVKLEERTLNHGGEIQALCFSPNSRLLASSSSDMTLKVWDTISAKEKFLLKGHAKGDGWLAKLDGLAFNPDGKVLVSGGAEGSIKVWDSGSGKLLHDLPDSETWVKALTFSPDGTLLASAASDIGKVILWEAHTWKPLVIFKEHKGDVQCLAFSPSGSLLATGGLHDGTIHLMDTRAGKLYCSFHHKKVPDLRVPIGVNSLAFGADDSLLASASNDGTACLWDTNKRELIREVSEHKWGCHTIMFSADGNTLACGGGNPSFRIVNLSSKHAYSIEDHGTGLQAAFPPGRHFFLIAENDTRGLQAINISDGQYIAGLDADEEYVTSMALSPNGKYAASGHKSGNVHLWNIENMPQSITSKS